jgi:hypothetical protein
MDTEYAPVVALLRELLLSTLVGCSRGFRCLAAVKLTVRINEQLITVIKSLLQQGQQLDNMVIYRDSSDGGLAAAAALKMRDQGLGLPAREAFGSGTLHPNQCCDSRSVRNLPRTSTRFGRGPSSGVTQ